RRGPILRHRPPRSRARSQDPERTELAAGHLVARLHRSTRAARPKRGIRVGTSESHHCRTRGPRPRGGRAAQGEGQGHRSQRRTRTTQEEQERMMDASQIGKRAWSYAGVLQDAGLSCFEYVEQLTLLLFLKMD